MWCGNDFKLLILGSNQREEYIYIYIYIYIEREREREREREMQTIGKICPNSRRN